MLLSTHRPPDHPADASRLSPGQARGKSTRHRSEGEKGPKPRGTCGRPRAIARPAEIFSPSRLEIKPRGAPAVSDGSLPATRHGKRRRRSRESGAKVNADPRDGHVTPASSAVGSSWPRIAPFRAFRQIG